jgi:hypothetical protein
MGYIEFIGAIGFGAIIVKLMDILWLQRFVRDKEHTAWLRDRRLEAYTTLSKELISFGLHRKDLGNPFEGFANVAEAILLIEDDSLIDRVDRFIVRLDEMKVLTDKGDTSGKANKIYAELSEEARKIIKSLRDALISNRRKM